MGNDATWAIVYLVVSWAQTHLGNVGFGKSGSTDYGAIQYNDKNEAAKQKASEAVLAMDLYTDDKGAPDRVCGDLSIDVYDAQCSCLCLS